MSLSGPAKESKGKGRLRTRHETHENTLHGKNRCTRRKLHRSKPHRQVEVINFHLSFFFARKNNDERASSCAKYQCHALDRGDSSIDCHGWR